MTDIKRFVISAPRSGLNWLRFCVEHFYGVRTPGKAVLISVQEDPSCAFVRSHDPLHGKTDAVAWTPIDPADTIDGRVILILRHPLETFARMANRKHRRFALYASNIRFYSSAIGEKRVFYYEDLIEDPAAMVAALDFLGLEPALGKHKPELADVMNDWAAIGGTSRVRYDVMQTRGGGSQTKSNPNDFTFHQRKLWWWERYLVWRGLSKALTQDELKLLDRYRLAGA